jgi:transcriptional regulator
VPRARFRQQVTPALAGSMEDRSKTMYIPKAFQISDISVLEAFITHNSFATLVSTVDGTLFATHLPLILDRTELSQGILLGHVARANPHWRAFGGQQEALAMFHGPHAYISPSWYTTSPAVPTWNYAVVHVYGVPRLVEDEVWLAHLVDRLVALYEADMPAPWPGVLPAEFKANLLKAIVGFTMDITRVEGKVKLGQNRPLGDQLGVVRHLEMSADPIAQALGELTKQQLGRDARAS